MCIARDMMITNYIPDHKLADFSTFLFPILQLQNHRAAAEQALESINLRSQSSTHKECLHTTGDGLG